MVRQLTIFVFLLSAVLIGCGHPSDERLIKQFHKKRALFEELCAMLQEDKGLVDVPSNPYTPTVPEDYSSLGITEERLVRYRAIMNSTGIISVGSANTGHDRILYFDVSAEGMVGSGSIKGYVYPMDGLLPTVESIDLYKHETEHYTVYRHIDGKWFLYFNQ